MSRTNKYYVKFSIPNYLPLENKFVTFITLDGVNADCSGRDIHDFIMDAVIKEHKNVTGRKLTEGEVNVEVLSLLDSYETK